MAAFRYWRLAIYRTLTQATVVIPEVALLDHVGGASLVPAANTAGAVATAAGSNSSNRPSLAFNQSVADWWSFSPTSYDTWLQYDFLTPTNVNEVDVTYHTDPQYQPALICVMASNDLITWLTSAAKSPSTTNSFSSTFDTTTLLPFSFTAVERVIQKSPGAGPARVSASLSIITANSSKSSGPGKIVGEVDITGTPPTPVASKEVRLHERSTGLLYATTKSLPGGAYAFTGLPIDRAFYVIAFDETLNYNAVIKDNIVPVVA